MPGDAGGGVMAEDAGAAADSCHIACPPRQQGVMNACRSRPTMNQQPSTAPPPDREEFAALARSHHRGLLVYARALCGDHATAADLVQDSLVTAWLNLARFDVTRNFGAWLRGIVRNKWREHLRRHAREVDVDEATLEAWEARFARADAARANTDPDLLEALEDCLQRLPEMFREPVRRFYYLEEPGETIAAALGIDPPALRKRLQRARHALRDCLDHKLATHA
jgi:RNA polymerase sigma-70 factor (ECF subfamily)